MVIHSANKVVQRLCWLAMLLLLSGCASLVGPREVSVPLVRLQAELNQRFPLKNRYLEVFDITLNQPRLMLQPEQNRIRLDFDVAIAPPLTSKRIAASLALSGTLRVDNRRNALMLADPKVERLQVDGVDAAVGRQFGKLGNFVAERIFMENPVLRFKDEDLRRAGVQFQAVSITVRSDALVVALEPVK